MQRAFRSPDELSRFAAALRGKGDFPAELPGVTWANETVVGAFAGEVEPGESVSVARASEMKGVLVVSVRRTHRELARPFDDSPPPAPPQEGAPSAPGELTPYVLVAVPRYDGPIRFLTARR